MTPIPEGATATIEPVTQRARGSTTVAPRALERLVGAVTADTFEVPARTVDVDLSDRHGLLALQIRTPIRVAALDRGQQAPVRDGTLIQRATDAQTTIRQRVTDLTGTKIAHVTVWLTGLDTTERRVI